MSGLSSPGFRIRTAQPGDLVTVESLARRIWPVCYASVISQEQIDWMLDELYNPVRLLQLYHQPQHLFWLLTSPDGEPWGYALAGPSREEEEQDWLLNRLYLLPEKQGLGLGQALLQTVAQEGKRQGFAYMSLFVNRKNPTVAWYQRQGFAIAESQDRNLGPWQLNDYRMVRSLDR